jgi:hypothetical protein
LSTRCTASTTHHVQVSDSTAVLFSRLSGERHSDAGAASWCVSCRCGCNLPLLCSCSKCDMSFLHISAHFRLCRVQGILLLLLRAPVYWQDQNPGGIPVPNQRRRSPSILARTLRQCGRTCKKQRHPGSPGTHQSS